MKKLLFLGIAAGLLATACAAYAYPTLAGPTGNGVLPTAAVVPAAQFQIAADFYNTGDDFPSNVVPVRVLYGLGGNFEVGAGYNFASDDGNTWNINAKYKTPLTFVGTTWSVGARYTNSSDLDTNSTSAYFVGTKALTNGEDTGVALNGSIGVNWTQIDFGATVDAFRFYAGLDAGFTNGLSMAVEYQTKSDSLESDALYSIVARYPIKPVMLQAGYTNAYPLDFNTGTDTGNFFAGLSYDFSPTK